MPEIGTYPQVSEGADDDSVLGLDDSAASGSQTSLFPLVTLRQYVGTIRITVSETSHGFGVGDVVRRTSSSWAVADASTLDDAMYAGMVVGVPDGDTFTLLMLGQVTGLSSLTDASWYYLQDDGSLDTTPGTVWCPVLVATGESTGFVVPARPMPNLGDLANVADGGAVTSSALVYDSGWTTIRNNVAAGTPGVGDDDGDGYAIGSRWYDVTDDNEYVCLDASTGAAVWKQTT